MPSLFSRARTNSTPQRKALSGSDDSQYAARGLDEFGRVSSPTFNRSLLGTPSKKDKKKDAKRSKTLPSGREDAAPSPDSPFPDGAFLPLNLERPRRDATDHPKEHDYGYLSYERHVVLGLDQVERLVEVISDELETRGGITTPFIFSTTALDISATSIKRIIRTFLETCQPYTGQRAQEAEAKWREEARFAGPHELAMCLRWGLARVIRSIGGQDVRGLVSWEHYMDFRESEAAMGYPPAHFATHFLPELEPPLQVIIVRLLSLLARLVANSTSSGHTPPTLSPLFGPLFFGLGPATLAFHHAYIHYLKATTAMEHIILAFVRWQDLPRISSTSNGQQSGSAASLGVPVRLREWIKGYPAVIPPLEMKKPQPRRGARTVRVMSVRRNVRMYSPDLVKTASTWAYVPLGSNSHNGLARSKEWERIAPTALKLQPRYSEAYKKRMDLPPNFHPDVAPGAPRELQPSQSDSSYLSTASSSTVTTNSDYFGIGVREGEDRFRSLTDLKWGEFESMGFSGIGDEKKLQFDLTESARTERAAKRQTLSWNDFSSSGFTRMDAPLSATLQFSTPLTTTISSWPSHSADINKKLKKTQKALPAFGWDTEPVVGNEEIIEESFLDVFCDLIYGGGWMDLERGEMLDRDCNWALVEYKSFPASRNTVAGGSDPRTSSTLILFEEFVPLEYREQLAVKSSSRRRLPSLFIPSSKKQWKQAATLNGRPYVVGHVPRSPSMREVEFEGMLHGSSTTKLISLNPKNPSTRTAVPRVEPPPAPPAVPLPKKVEPAKPSPPAPAPVPVAAPPAPPVSEEAHPPAPKSDEMHSDSTTSHSVRKSLFRLPSTPGSMRRSMVPAEHTTVEFDTRMASYSDDDQDSGRAEPEHVKQKRRESSTDAWVDILVGSQERRLGGQDAELGDKKRSPQSQDPDKVGLEVAQVLAAVKDRSPSPESLMEPVESAYDMNQIVRDDDSDIDEVDTVPRTSDARSLSEEHHGLPYDQPDGDVSDDEDGAITNPALLKARELANQRRVGYFALHPERRAANTQSVVVEDIRNRLANDSDSEVGHDEDEQYGAHESVRPLPMPPVVPITPPKPHIYEPKPLTPPRPQSTATTLSQSPEVRQGLTTIVIPPAPVTHGPLPAAPAAPSKTAALIEMYRERERGASASPKNVSTPTHLGSPTQIGPLPASRLPVRVGSLPNVGISPVLQPPTMPVLGASSSPRHSPQPVVIPLEPSINDIPRINLEETGRASPGRYVHGAPLQNVIEEDEEC